MAKLTWYNGAGSTTASCATTLGRYQGQQLQQLRRSRHSHVSRLQRFGKKIEKPSAGPGFFVPRKMHFECSGWSGWRESNPRIQLGRLLLYH